MLLEVCANSIQSALAAQEGGAQRIELCQNLEQGGITPSIGLIEKTLKLLHIPVFVLIRPRPYNFVYDANEIAIMQRDIEAVKQAGCSGIVTGALTGEGKIDMAACKILIKSAGDLQLTFHRAFDEVKDKNEALSQIIDLGFHRILTSGGKSTAIEGFGVIQDLVNVSRDIISIMPGAGITKSNLKQLIESTGAKEFHASAKSLVNNIYQTDVCEVAEMISVLKTTSV